MTAYAKDAVAMNIKPTRSVVTPNSTYGRTYSAVSGVPAHAVGAFFFSLADTALVPLAAP